MALTGAVLHGALNRQKRVGSSGIGRDAVEWKVAALLRFSIVRPPLYEL